MPASLLRGLAVALCATAAAAAPADASVGASLRAAKPGVTAGPVRRPVVLMHGLMATASAMSHAQGWIEEDFPGIYIKNVENVPSKIDSLLVDINKQVEIFAEQVRSDPELAHGFNLIGHSQGGLIGRAYIHRFNDPPVHNFISWAGPQAGVYGVPDFNALCPDALCPWLAELFDDLLRPDGTSRVAESLLTFAAYWRSPLNYSDYLANNHFLADINNEKEVKNATYKANFESLNHLALLYSEKDGIVVPRQSPYFTFFDTVGGSDKRIVPWNEQPIYTEDFIGYKTLDDAGKVTRWGVSCGHQDVPRDVCKNESYVKVTRDLLDNYLPNATAE